MLKTTLQKQTFTSQADGTKFTDHLTFEIIEDKDKDNHQIKISMITEFDIVEFVCSVDKFSEAVSHCSTINNLNSNIYLGSGAADTSTFFRQPSPHTSTIAEPLAYADDIPTLDRYRINFLIKNYPSNIS